MRELHSGAIYTKIGDYKTICATTNQMFFEEL